MFEVIGQGIGFVAVLFSFFVFIQKERKKLLCFKLVTDFLWILHFLMIGAYTPMLVTAIAVFRELAFISKNKSVFLKSKLIPIVLCVLFFLCAALTWKGFQSLISPLASSLSTIAFFNDEVKKIRFVSLIVSILMFINGIVFNSYANILNEIITICSIIVGIIRAKNIKNKG